MGSLWAFATQGKLLRPFRKSDLESKAGIACPESWLTELFGGGTCNSGIVVTAKNAMQCAAVRCAVQAISETLAQLPIHVHSRQEGGGKERATDHPLYSLLHDAANEYTSAFCFKESLTRDALLQPHGGFAFINRIEGKPVELLRLDPELVTCQFDKLTGEPSYKYSDPKTPNSQRVFAAKDILHIPSPSLSGCGLVHDARESIGLALVLEAHAARLFSRGARPSGMLSFKGNMSPDTLQKAKTAWQNAHGGTNGGGTAVLPGDAEWQALTLNSVDAQFLQLRAFSIEEIARVFRVPPIFLQSYGRATWANGEEMGRQFLTYTLLPWIERWQGEIRLKLLTPEERQTYVAEFMVDSLLRGDFDKRMDGYTKAIAARILSSNEARAMENRPPYEGGDKFENPNVIPATPASAAK